jgi:aconitate hydratase 2 / 2-methylisocitrate dehydratase
MLSAYHQLVESRAALGIPPLPLDAKQTSELCELLKNPPPGEEKMLLHLLRDRIPPGVDPAAYVKAGFLSAIAKSEITSPLVSPIEAVELLGTMMGGYNVQSLIDLLQVPTVGVSDSSATPLVMGGQGKEPIAAYAAVALSKILLVYDAYHDVLELSKTNPFAKRVIDSWADAEWFTTRSQLPESITVTVFKVLGETNTDDLSPAQHATTRPDIPLPL